MAERKTSSEVEQELKIRLSREDLEKVLKIFVRDYPVKKVAHKYLPRAYYDTEAFDLYNNQISLRIQYKPGKEGVLGGYEQTVKFPVQGSHAEDDAGTVVRRECKDVLPSHQPSLAAVQDGDARAMTRPYRGLSLKHIFTAAIERRYFDVEAGKGASAGKIEVAFDVGELILAANPDVRQAFAEIELELKDGSPKSIKALQDKILRLAPSAVIEAFTSKMDEGMKFYKSHAKEGRKP